MSRYKLLANDHLNVVNIKHVNLSLREFSRVGDLEQCKVYLLDQVSLHSCDICCASLHQIHKGIEEHVRIDRVELVLNVLRQ
jgi:hypothetical protein